jgi:hypothetical protein
MPPGAHAPPDKVAMGKVAQLSVLPGTFTAAALATILGWEEDLEPTSPTRLKAIQDLQAVAPGQHATRLAQLHHGSAITWA